MNAFSVRSIGRSGCLMAMAAALAVSGTVVTPLSVPNYQVANAAAVVSVTVRERLSSYGGWQTSRRFGEVWVPSVAARWRPYTDGRWIWTDDGWYWQSDEPFGVIVYHYGNWVYDDDLGWVWIAGDEWAPAWVVWRESDEDIGWVPAPPPQVHVVVEDAWWAFAPVAAIGAVNILREVRPAEDNVTIVRNTTIINNTTVVNNYNDRRTVRLGDATVPVNAGPQLSRLPRPVFRALKAARVAPPAKGKFVAAHLDATKGAAVKQMAMRQAAPNSAPADQQTGQAVVKPEAKPMNGAQPPTAPKAPAVAAGAQNGAIGSPKPGATMAKQAHPGKSTSVATAGATKRPQISSRQAPRMAKAAPARPAPVKKTAANKPHPDRMVSVGRSAPRHMPANAQVAKLNRPRPKAAGPHRPAPAGKRAPVSCNPRDPHCKRPD